MFPAILVPSSFFVHDHPLKTPLRETHVETKDNRYSLSCRAEAQTCLCTTRNQCAWSDRPWTGSSSISFFSFGTFEEQRWSQMLSLDTFQASLAAFQTQNQNRSVSATQLPNRSPCPLWVPPNRSSTSRIAARHIALWSLKSRGHFLFLSLDPGVLNRSVIKT